MTDRSDPQTLELGPAARRQLEAVVGQVAGGLLAVAIEAAGLPPDDQWSLTIERATLTRTPSAPAQNGAAPTLEPASPPPPR